MQRSIQVTEEAYNAFKKLKGENMSFTKLILQIVKQQKELNQMRVKYDNCCNELEALKASINNKRW